MSLNRANIEEQFGPVYWVRNVPWLVRNRILSPLFLPHELPEYSNSDLKEALGESGAYLAWWVDQWDQAKGEFYWISCDTQGYSEVDVRNSRYRKLVRKGNRLGQVKRIDPSLHGTSIFSIFKGAHEVHGRPGHELEDEEDFLAALELKSRSEFHEFWAVFAEDKMLAYCECVLINDAVRLISGKLDHAFRKLNPNNAMFYSLTEFYMGEGGKKYVTNGQKTIHHPTNVNTLFENLGYRRVFCRPRISYSPMLGPAASILATKLGSTLAKNIPLPHDIKAKLDGLIRVIELQKEEEG